MRALLDVNMLIALADQDHVGYDTAHAWLKSECDDGWASCAITENGMVRILSQPSYPHALSPAVATDMLARTCRGSDHRFWPCDVTVRDPRALTSAAIIGPRQVTDAYLLALAVAHGGRLVTFDQGISLAAVPGAAEGNLIVLD